MAVTKAVEQVTDWTAVAQNTVGESSALDCSGHYATLLTIQATLDTTTAHTGTRFMIQVSSHATSDEDWHDYAEFVALVGTALTDLIEDNPLAAGSTVIALTGHGLTALALWLFIEDSTLVDSELVFEVAQAANSITVLDGTTNAHAQNTAIFNIAISRSLILDIAVYRARVLVDNTYDADGSTLNYRVRASEVTGI